MVRVLCHTILLLGMSALVYAQQDISVGVHAWSNIRLATFHSGWDAGWNGAGLSIGLHKSLKDNIQANVSGEVGAAGIGNYVAGKAGISLPIQIGSSRWAYTPGFDLVQGMALSRPNPLYMWGLEQTNGIDFRLKNSSGPGVVFSFRIYGFPGYNEYSRVHSFVDLKAGIRYSF